ncbi:MAG: formate dehydrogenase accessory protein FdhE, partial [Acetobacteraceae bacterium]|nr:formate dehydrogenase accessory protein FdhE [Acetobacteraceae bacterium]
AKCRCYIKHLQQQRDPALEPFADDIASYGLDLLLREQGFRRGGINPLFIAE